MSIASATALFPFQPVSSDQSIAYLSNLFGGLGQIPGAPGILASMFQIFNSLILVVGLFVVIYVVVVGVITTAHEGEFLGKKFHGVWTPMRVVLGIVALVPTASGYSGLQIVIMWFIIQGIGAADILWNGVITYVETYGSIYAKGSTLGVGVTTSLQQLFAGLTCAATTSISNNSLAPAAAARWSTNTGGTQGGFGNYAGDGSSPVAVQTCNSSGCTLQLGPGGYCGTLQFSNPSTTSDPTLQAIMTAQRTVLIGANNASANTIVLTPNVNATSMLDKLYLLAYAFANADLQYVNFYSASPDDPTNSNCAVTPAPPNCAAANRPVYMGTPLDPNPQSPWGWLTDNYCNNATSPITPCCRSTPGSACTVPTGQESLNQSNFPDPDKADNGPTDVSSQAAMIYLNANIKPTAIAYPNFWQENNSPAAPLGTSNTPTTLFTIDQLQTKQGSDFMNAILSNLSTIYTDAIQAAIPPPPVNNYLEEMRPFGWMFAGAFYYTLSTGAQNNIQAANPYLNFGNSSGGKMTSYRNNLSGASQIFGGGGSSAEAIAPFSSAIAGAKTSVLDGFMASVTNPPSAGFINPLIKLQSFGQSLLLTVEILYPIMMAFDILLGVASTVSSILVAGFGAAAGTYPVMVAINMFLMPILLGLFGIMLSIGGLLAVYTPLIPYIIFTMGVIGWFISVVEAMVAAPLVALGILSPSAQHHELLGKAEPALMLVFGLILRPSLMIFGLIAGMLLAGVAVMLINATFGRAMLQIIGAQTDAAGNHTQDYVDFLELIFFMAAYLFLILSALNKCFSVIATLPSKVMLWLSHQGEGADTEALGEVKSAISSAGGKAAGAATASTQMGVGKGLVEATGEDRQATGAAKQSQAGGAMGTSGRGAKGGESNEKKKKSDGDGKQGLT